MGKSEVSYWHSPFLWSHSCLTADTGGRHPWQPVCSYTAPHSPGAGLRETRKNREHILKSEVSLTRVLKSYSVTLCELLTLKTLEDKLLLKWNVWVPIKTWVNLQAQGVSAVQYLSGRQWRPGRPACGWLLGGPRLQGGSWARLPPASGTASGQHWKAPSLCWWYHGAYTAHYGDRVMGLKGVRDTVREVPRVNLVQRPTLPSNTSMLWMRYSDYDKPSLNILKSEEHGHCFPLLPP